MVMSLAPWDKRERIAAGDRRADITGMLKQVPGVRISRCSRTASAFAAPATACNSRIVGNSYKELGDAANKIVAEMEKDPRFQQPRLSQSTPRSRSSPWRSTASAPPTSASTSPASPTALQAMLDGHEVGDVFIEDRSYEVKLVSTTNPINDPTDLENIFLKTARRPLRAGRRPSPR